MLVALAVLMPVSAVVASTPQPDTRGVDGVVRVLEELAARIARDRLSAPRSSRLYAAAGLGLVAAWDAASSTLSPSLPDGLDLPEPAAKVEPIVAAIVAAATVERTLFKLTADKSTFGSARDEALAAVSRELDPQVVVDSSAFGVDVAIAVLAYVASDGIDALPDIKPPATKGPGIWAPTPPNYQPAIEPGWGTLRTFRSSSKKCTLGAPERSGPTDSPYQDQANQVAEVTRNLTTEQQAIARFWDDGRGRTGTPSGHWFILALEEGRRAGASIDTLVHLVADMSMVVADTFIVVWREKYKWLVERPITVLQRADSSWSSYLVTPAFPEYPSGHSAISRAAATVITSYLGDRKFTDPGWGMTGPSRSDFEIEPRTFTSYMEAAAEASQSRLFAGIHYPMGISAGSRVGACIARAWSEPIAGRSN